MKSNTFGFLFLHIHKYYVRVKVHSYRHRPKREETEAAVGLRNHSHAHMKDQISATAPQLSCWHMLNFSKSNDKVIQILPESLHKRPQTHTHLYASTYDAVHRLCFCIRFSSGRPLVRFPVRIFKRYYSHLATIPNLITRCNKTKGECQQ